MPFLSALPLDQLPVGGLKTVDVDGTPVLLSNADGTIYATSDTCCHMGAPLELGTLVGTTLTCAYHLWPYDVRDGSCLVNPGAHLLTYPIRIEDGQIFVEI